ncbi:MAG TPA: pectate lyase [Anaerohalosphaeraceae bacterium]|jgi:hypothetical protein|nr:pectate lyase [Anaerohalosphaeraceae bacterium]HRT49819.1 pectate lyase [Anaerohalosphaeraceae bacterium]HRT85522.1 pectate lyase [Anaerohalosphaeraceae bacterium]
MKRVLLAGLVVVAMAAGARGEDTLPEEARAALRKATAYFRSIATNGGYAGIYSLDLKERYGEAVYEKARATEIWVQPPGTPTVGQCYLRAWRATGDAYYLDAARDVARALVWGQRAVGGWDHRVDAAHLTPDAKQPKRAQGACTFDDKITQGALEFLIEADGAIDEPWLDEAVELGLEFMLKSQFENGAWPQWYPLRGGYHDYYTFNDNAMNDCILLMLKAHKVYGKEAYLQSARKCGDFIIASQLDPPQAGWAQQYDHDLRPAWARAFEPPGVCSAVTARNIRTLIALYLYTKDAKYLTPIPAAIEWLNASMLGEHLWARVYEVGTNRPIYGDRENGNKIIYDYDKLSERERTSYGWRGEYGIEGTIRYYEQIVRRGEAAFAEEPEPTAKQRASRARSLAGQVRTLIETLDEQGRWVRDGWITCATFTRNVMVLCEYLECVK